MPSINPSSAQWPQNPAAALNPDLLGLELDSSETAETYVFSDTPTASITFVSLDADTLVVNA